MNIGIPKERRSFEYRVGLHPSGVKMLTKRGHTCYVEHDAGSAAGFSDLEYEQAGGRVVYSSHEVFGRSDLLLKVGRPLLEEVDWLRDSTALAGLLHLGPSRHEKIDMLLKKHITAIAYEQITLADGTVPIRKPLSAIGGTLAAQIGSRLLQTIEGGKGILMGGCPGVPPAEVVILGAGISGTNAAKAFMGMGAHVTVLDTNLSALEIVINQLPGISTMLSNAINVEAACTFADILVGAILIAGERPPVIVTREMLRTMKPRSVVIDISIDEGGCIETSRLTTHEKPTFIEEGIIHYCVPNISSVVARTATYAYLNAAFPFILEMVEKGIDQAIEENPAIERGVGTQDGHIRHISSLSPLTQME
jgi:alanine dehydrogenase